MTAGSRTPIQLDPGLWIVEGSNVSFYGLPFPTRMTLIRLADGSLVVHSPIAPDDVDFDAVEALGPIAAIIGPNKIHHLFMPAWIERYPDAAVYGTAELVAKRSDLRFTGALDDDAPELWAAEIDQCLVRGSKVMEELVLFHRQSQTAIVADFVENFDPVATPWWMRLLARPAGILAPHGGMPRDWRMTFRDKQALGKSLARILAWQPKRLIMSHGLIVEPDAEDFLRRSFKWALKE